jgi:hypothetical protein
MHHFNRHPSASSTSRILWKARLEAEALKGRASEIDRQQQRYSWKLPLQISMNANQITREMTDVASRESVREWE